VAARAPLEGMVLPAVCGGEHRVCCCHEAGGRLVVFS
jgi:hypothetical protein